MRRGRGWLLAALLLALSACAAQAPPRVTGASLPRLYDGRYFWAEQASGDGYRVTLTIDSVSVAGGGIPLAVHGSIVYDPGDNRMAIDGTIDAVTLDVRLRESAPSQADAVTNGAFTGALSPDLQSLVAIWRSDGDGRLGVLVLHACGEAAPH